MAFKDKGRKVKKIRFTIDTGFTGCVYEEEEEFPDDVTDEKLRKYLNELIGNYIDGSYEEISVKNKK